MLVEREVVAEGQTREGLGRDKFLERVWRYKADKAGDITEQIRRLGASADWSREKFTLVCPHPQGLIFFYVFFFFFPPPPSSHPCTYPAFLPTAVPFP